MESIFCSNNIFYLIPRYFLNFWPNICIYIEINWNYLFRTPQERSLVCLLYQHAGSIYTSPLCHFSYEWPLSQCLHKKAERIFVCVLCFLPLIGPLLIPCLRLSLEWICRFHIFSNCIVFFFSFVIFAPCYTYQKFQM